MLLAADIVHLWHADLSPNPALEKKCSMVLTNDEHRRANRFQGETLKRRFVLCRGQLRFLLSNYLSIPAASIEFDTGKHGKPFLADHMAINDFVFNVSHSGDSALFGVATGGALGVDVEFRKKINDFEGLVNRCFGDNEKRYWHSLEQSRQQHDFFRIWTCKESFIKAVGKGISVGLERCEVETESFTHFSKIPTEYGKPEQWLLKEIDIEGELNAAVTIDNRLCRIVTRRIAI